VNRGSASQKKKTNPMWFTSENEVVPGVVRHNLEHAERISRMKTISGVAGDKGGLTHLEGGKLPLGDSHKYLRIGRGLLIGGA